MESHLQLKFVTKQREYAVPDNPFSVLDSVSVKELNQLINSLLKDGREDKTDEEFDFLLLGELVRSSLADHLVSKNATSEAVLEVEYFVKYPTPTPDDSLAHDDWVSGVNATKDWILSGCYDNTVHIWSIDGEHKLTIPGHSAPVKAVAWLKHGRFFVCFSLQTPLMTLSGHTDGVTGVQWIDTNEVVTCGLDCTLRIWDVELGGLKSQLNGSKAFLGIAYSPLSKLLVSGSSDRHVRLWDPRTKDGTLVKCVFSSHNLWITSLAWSPTDEHHFVSGSMDSIVKLWDTRSPKTPLFDISGHEDKIFSVDWSLKNYIISGGADNHVKLYKFEETRNSTGHGSQIDPMET
ncbi:ribosome biogenesis protein WDR12 homolog [Parasteatoda tepidariorum]|uniref:ribosome biogenesis protein WDR12 homolog n=1 Tax=Parasteatoda tepidariorum TaxID=114398 RepID=UPI0039BCFDA2